MPAAWTGLKRSGKRCRTAGIMLLFCLYAVLCAGCGQDGVQRSRDSGDSGGRSDHVEGAVAVQPDIGVVDAKQAWQETDSIAEWESSLMAGSLHELRAEAVRGVSVVRGGMPLFAVSYEPRSYKNSFDCWAVSVPYKSLAAVDTEAMYDYFHVLAELELTPVEDTTQGQAGTESSEDTIFVAYYKEQTAQGGLAEPDRGIFYRFGSRNGDGDYYVEAAGQLWTADGSAVEKLFGVNPYDCILKVVSVVSVDSVSRVEITHSGENHELQVRDDAFSVDGKTMKSEDFYVLYSELMSIFIEKELPDDYDTDRERELLMGITYRRNTREAPAVVQRYYAYDEEYAVAQVNGAEFFLVKRAALNKLQERVTAALEAASRGE
mgnify:CR=1 FL=1